MVQNGLTIRLRYYGIVDSGGVVRLLKLNEFWKCNCPN
jgi:hypothetical protein